MSPPKMSIEIINHNLDEDEKNSSTSQETLNKRSSSLENHHVKATISSNPPELHEISSNDPVSTQLKIISQTPGQSHVSVYNKVQPSSSSCQQARDSDLCSAEITLYKEFRKVTLNNQCYEGALLRNNYHGFGFLSTEEHGLKIFYDGLFYVNKLEGYSQIFYENGTNFQGLFNQHKRFGPGILTYKDGSQDVGFWNGFRLIRLASVVGSELVPRLVSSASGKTKLLCHRYLISLREECENTDIDADSLKYFDEYLNPDVRNTSSSFFHKAYYDKFFFGERNCDIKVILHEGESEMYTPEQENTLFENDYQQRIMLMGNKIAEMTQKLQPLSDIKKSLSEKLRTCTECCETKESIESSEKIQDAVADIQIATVVSDNDETSGMDFGSLRPDLSFLDGSIRSDDIYTVNTAEPVDPTLEASISEKILQFCDCGEQEVDDLQNLEDQLTNITKQQRFYGSIRDSLQHKLNKLLENGKPTQKFKTIRVDELWAWNNEASLIDIQKHTFRHRHFEDNVNFNVHNLILGNRKEFGSAGNHEKICEKFLIACSIGDGEFVKQCLRNGISPNLSDARGNTGVFFAASSNKIRIIPILTNFGAKLDQLNDEALTPLVLCILKYLSLKFECQNWETSFFPEIINSEVADLPEWYSIKSFFSMSSTSSNHSNSLDPSSSPTNNSRIAELSRRLSSLPQYKECSSKNVFPTPYLFDLHYGRYENAVQQVDNQSNQNGNGSATLKSVHLTIMALLEYGANPNIGEVPYPALVLSLFSENHDLVRQLLEASADANVSVTNDHLSCLHIMASLNCSMSNLEICRLLIKHNCNPNLKTLPSHWEGVKSYFIGKLAKDYYVADFGKNALHLLCMRKDFERDDCDYFCLLGKTLIDSGIDYDEKFLGHTALSLAVLAGNIRLVKCLLKTNLFNPYESLGYNMGNILTLFTLKRFENSLPTEKCKAVLTALYELDVNVLYGVGASENSIAFAELGDALFKSQLSEKEEEKKTKQKIKSNKTEKHTQCVIMTDVLKDLGRQTIIKQIQMLVTEILYDFTEESYLSNKEISIALAEFLTPEIAIDYLELLFHTEKIEKDRINHSHIRCLLDFVNSHKKVEKLKKTPKNQKKSNEKKSKDVPKTEQTEETMDKLIARADFDKRAIVRLGVDWIVKPGLDDPRIYQICFHCLKSIGKNLKLCPRCQLIRFCSTQCNKLSIKLKTRHTCNLYFYEMTEEQREEISRRESLEELFKVAKHNCLIRLYEKRQQRLANEEQKLLEMWRADTYGTKLRPILEKIASRQDGKTLTWNVVGLQKYLERNFQKNPADFDAYSVEALLNRLKSRKQVKMANNFSRRKSAGSSFVGSKSLTQSVAELKLNKTICRCSEQKSFSKHKRRENLDQRKRQRSDKYENPNNARLLGPFETSQPNFRVNEDGTVMRKLKKIPERYQRFLQIMGTYFPDIDLSSWVLPYACYSNGQLFYKFCDGGFFKESYSFS